MDVSSCGRDGDTCDVDFRGVTKRYADVVAVDDLNLRIRRGEFFSLLGPSGCGKTTTLRMVAGFEDPTEGRILLCGEPMSNVPPYRRSVNTVFQDYALFPHLNVRKNIEYGLKRNKVPADEMKTRVDEALYMVEMQSMQRRRPNQLSGGQQQRVALARALVNRPTVLLLDEPLGALDAKLRKAMQLELKKLQREVGITFIYVTHDQEEALTMSDRIAVMSQGRVEQVASPKEIYEAPDTAFVANFIGVSNVFASRVQAVGENCAECETEDGLTMSVALGSHDIQVGDNVQIVIRPEKLVLRSPGARQEAENGQNCFKAQVKVVIYVGSLTQFVVDVEGKHPVQVLQQNLFEDENREWYVGQEVRVSFRPSACSVITDVGQDVAAQDLMGEVVKRS
jgi:spermidine/putrescine transport system ATP-binding protein